MAFSYSTFILDQFSPSLAANSNMCFCTSPYLADGLNIKGNPNRGLKIWIFGLVERESNRLLLYPVSDRTEETYVNKETKEEVEVHTNRIEGAWKHAKDHFRKMAGTKLTQFEGHLAEIMWRADVKTNIYSCFFDQLRSIYTLTGPPVYHYTTPLFETWTGILEASDSQLTYWEIKPENTDAETESSTSDVDHDDIPVITSDTTSSSIPPNREL
uniref:Uncharacterized protein n=1 Tax=Magallana gigas TaxID=29159 RepID=A0A8W8MNP1_MAGGI